MFSKTGESSWRQFLFVIERLGGRKHSVRCRSPFDAMVARKKTRVNKANEENQALLNHLNNNSPDVSTLLDDTA